MRTRCTPARTGPRLLALAAAATGVAATALVLAVPTLLSFRVAWAASVPPFERWVAAAAGAALVLCAGWLALVALACALEATTGTASGPLARVVPAVVRRTALLGCGVAVGTAALTVPAAAHEEAPLPAAAASRHTLAGLPMPDRQPGPPRPTYTVRPGDSLWSVAAGRLPHGASELAIDATWRRVYALNREVIGEDPDLLLPGTTLRLPSSHPSPG